MEISLAAETIFHIGSFPVTNSMLMSWLAAAILIIVSLLATRIMRLVPSGIQNFFETIIEFLFNLVNDVIGSREQTKKYFPLIATIFLFVITNNWLGLIPGVGTIKVLDGEKWVPLLRSGNADLNTTLAIALVTMIAVQIFGILAIGIFKYGKKFFNFKNPIYTMVGFLELLGEFSRMISFTFRLFGNIFAGEVLLTIVAFLVPYIAPLPFFGLELFVGMIQALVFSMLALVFIKMAITSHEEAH
jgi:F-type H+-transporting ATPase subunit a